MCLESALLVCMRNNFRWCVGCVFSPIFVAMVFLIKSYSKPSKLKTKVKTNRVICWVFSSKTAMPFQKYLSTLAYMYFRFLYIQTQLSSLRGTFLLLIFMFERLFNCNVQSHENVLKTIDFCVINTGVSIRSIFCDRYRIGL